MTTRRFTTTKAGRRAEIVKTRIGAGVTDPTIWEIHSEERLSDQEIIDIIEREYPSAGYGASHWTRFPTQNHHQMVKISSFSSCD